MIELRPKVREHMNARIHKEAYNLWNWAGRPEGKDLEFWLEAEAAVIPIYEHSHRISQAMYAQAENYEMFSQKYWDMYFDLVGKGLI